MHPSSLGFATKWAHLLKVQSDVELIPDKGLLMLFSQSSSIITLNRCIASSLVLVVETSLIGSLENASSEGVSSPLVASAPFLKRLIFTPSISYCTLKFTFFMIISLRPTQMLPLLKNIQMKKSYWIKLPGNACYRLHIEHSFLVHNLGIILLSAMDSSTCLVVVRLFFLITIVPFFPSIFFSPSFRKD